MTNHQQLVGKTAMLGVMNPSADLHAMLVKEGATLDKLNLQRMSLNIKDLIYEKVDVMAAYSTTQPFFLEKQGIKFDVIRPSTYGFDFYGDLLFTSREEIENHPERVVGYVDS